MLCERTTQRLLPYLPALFACVLFSCPTHSTAQVLSNAPAEPSRLASQSADLPAALQHPAFTDSIQAKKLALYSLALKHLREVAAPASESTDAFLIYQTHQLECLARIDQQNFHLNLFPSETPAASAKSDNTPENPQEAPSPYDAQKRALLTSLSSVSIPTDSELTPYFYFWKAQNELQLGLLRDTEISLSAIPEEHPLYVYTLITQALVEYLGQDPTGALSTLELALKDDKKTSPSREALVKALNLACLIEIKHGKPQDALDRLKKHSKLTETHPLFQLIQAKAYLALEDWKAAENLLKKLTTEASLPESLMGLLVLERVQALQNLDQNAQARQVLLARASEETNAELIPLILDSLVSMGALQEESIRAQFIQWAQATPSPGTVANDRSYLAAIILAEERIRQGEAHAIAQLAELAEKIDPHPYAHDAAISAAQAWIRQGQLEQAAKWIQSWQTSHAEMPPLPKNRFQFLKSNLFLVEGKFKDAVTGFLNVIQSSGLPGIPTELIKRTEFNLLLSESISESIRDPRKTLNSLLKDDRLSTRVNASHLAQEDMDEILLELALYQATHQLSQAKETLEAYLQRAPSSRRSPEARLALAELSLLESPPQPSLAIRELSNLSIRGNLDHALRERADRLRFWIEWTSENWKAAAENAEAYLRDWPDSTESLEIRLKFAESLYRAGNHAQANVEFTKVATQSPKHPWTEAAWFFAGKSSEALMNIDALNHAIQAWNHVIQEKGQLEPAARIESALAYKRLGDLIKAEEILSPLLVFPTPNPKSVAPTKTPKKPQEDPPNTSESSIWSIRANLSLAGIYLDTPSSTSQPKPWEKAIPLLSASEELIKKIDATLPEAFQTYVLQARCHHLSQELDQALLACNRVLTPVFNARDLKHPPVETFWIYRAGFEALAILEKQKNWEASIAIADRLAQLTGERSKEAAELAKKLRLQHFIWDEAP